MWSEKRGIEDIIFFATLPILINVATNLAYFLKGGSYSMVEIVNEFNCFTIFGVLICCFLNFFTKQNKLSEEEKDILNKKMFGMKLLGVAFVGYIIFSFFIIRNNSINISSVIMFLSYINWYMIKIKGKAIGETGLTETQKKWREFHNTPTYEQSSLSWKIKPMLSPHVSVSFGERIKHINWFVLIFVVPLVKSFTLEALPMLIIVSTLMLSDILYFIDAIFGLYSETEGICTGIVEKERGGEGSPRERYYEVYVTDVVNRREIKFKVDNYFSYREGDSIKLIHGGLSKKVIKNHYNRG